MNLDKTETQVNLFEVDFTGGQELNGSEVVLEPQEDGSQRAVIQGDAGSFSDVAEVVDTVTEPVEVEVTAEPLKPGFTDFWRAYAGAVKDAEERMDTLSKQSFGFMAIGHGLGASFNGHFMLKETRESLIDSIYRMAERQFAPAGGKLSIERESNEIMGKDEEFDPDRLWLFLDEKYGGQAGVELGYKQLARTLVTKLGLRNNAPVRKTNRIELQQSAHAEPRFKGGWEYSYNTFNWIRETVTALQAFCVWAEDPVSAMKLGDYVRRMGHYDEVKSRQRIDLGSVQMVTFLKSVTYEILGDLGDKFHEFIATYGAEALTDTRY